MERDSLGGAHDASINTTVCLLTGFLGHAIWTHWLRGPRSASLEGDGTDWWYGSRRHKLRLGGQLCPHECHTNMAAPGCATKRSGARFIATVFMHIRHRFSLGVGAAVGRRKYGW